MEDKPAVGADGLTNDQWIESSRPNADENLMGTYRQENKTKENEEKSLKSQNSANSDGDTDWAPLTKKMLSFYYLQTFGTIGNDNQLGSVFEVMFQKYVLSQAFWLPFAVHINIEKYIGGDRYTIPDFVGNAPYLNRDIRKSAYIRNALWFELKAKSGGLYLSSNEWQIKGHIDNLARTFEAQMEEHRGFAPALYLVTTSDVSYSPGIAAYALGKNVNYGQIISEFRLINHVWKFRFN